MDKPSPRNAAWGLRAKIRRPVSLCHESLRGLALNTSRGASSSPRRFLRQPLPTADARYNCSFTFRQLTTAKNSKLPLVAVDASSAVTRHTLKMRQASVIFASDLDNFTNYARHSLTNHQRSQRRNTLQTNDLWTNAKIRSKVSNKRPCFCIYSSATDHTADNFTEDAPSNANLSKPKPVC
jgi:hypothetical protein